MNGIDLVMVFAIILFARLGVRLVTRYLNIKRENKDKNNDKKTEETDE